MKILLIIILFMFSFWGTGRVDLGLDELKESSQTQNLSLNDVKNQGYVVFEDGDVTMGQDIWAEFTALVNQKKPAKIKLAYYYTLGDESHYDPEYLETIRDEYPALYLETLSYNGTNFTIEETVDGKQISKEYQYLKKYEGKPSSRTAAFSEYTYYVLTDDDSVTWEQIEWGMFSSQMEDGIEHKTVYSDLR